jgi:t-SNARE complex subunit (syntaxin)
MLDLNNAMHTRKRIRHHAYKEQITELPGNLRIQFKSYRIQGIHLQTRAADAL